MSDSLENPSSRHTGIDEYAPYAPKRIRDAGLDVGQTGSAVFETGSGPALSGSEPLGYASDEHGSPSPPRFQRNSAPTPLAEPIFAVGPRAGRNHEKQRRRPGKSLKAWLLFIGVGTIAGVWTNGAITGGNGLSALWRRSESSGNIADRVVAKLSASDATPRPMGEPSPLGVTVRDLTDGGLIVVKGLADGMQLSAGNAADNNSWWMSAKDLENAVIQPPRDFVGSMDIDVELRLPDTSLSDRKTLRFEWENEPTSEVKTATSESPPKPQAGRQLASEEVIASLKRGKDLIANGDFAAARLVLQRVADSGNAQGAMMLAGTYDPTMLEKLKAHGCAPDIQRARYWYEKANELGSPEAPKRLKLLAIRRD
jgi:hypothetical protein